MHREEKEIPKRNDDGGKMIWGHRQIKKNKKTEKRKKNRTIKKKKSSGENERERRRSVRIKLMESEIGSKKEKKEKKNWRHEGREERKD